MNKESVDILIQRAAVLKTKNTTQALTLLDEAMARQDNYKRGIAYTTLEQGVCLFFNKNYSKSLSTFNNALYQMEMLEDQTGILRCYQELGNVYYHLGDCAQSLAYHLESLRISTDHGDLESMAHEYDEIGKLYLYLKDFEKTINYFKKALNIYEQLKQKVSVINSYYLLGNAYNWMDEEDKAQYYLLRSLHALEHVEDNDAKVRSLECLAILYIKEREFEKALNHINEAINLVSLCVNKSVRGQLLKTLGNLYIELTQFDKAIEVLNRAVKHAPEYPLDGQLVIVHELLAIAHEKIGDTNKSYHHFKKYYELSKKLTSEEVNLKVAALQIKYDLEELKKQKEIAELSDKLKEQFLANVSHEIRTPMNGVIGMAHLLSKTNPNTEQQEYIAAIKVSANNLMVIINDILDFSKINAGKIEFSEQEFNPRELFKGIMQILSVKAEEKGINIGCIVDYSVPETIVGDPIRLNQIILNLVTNAVKFTEHGKVVLHTEMVADSDKNIHLRFKVIDSGIGIPEDKLNTIFDSFSQVENNKRRGEGTGLGLSIVKQLVELQGGSITVKSKVNKGSEFEFELSFKKVEGRVPVPRHRVADEKKEDKDFSNACVLVVEDNKVNQLLVKNILKKFGFKHIDIAESGRAALDLVDKKEYHIILMDIQMPEMDGYDVTKNIRSKFNKELKQVPIIALTADATANEKQKAAEAGMDDYIVKPYTPEELLRVMNKYIPHTNENILIKHASPVHSETTGIHFEHLDKFTSGDAELTTKLIEIFLQQVPECIEDIEKALTQKNWNTIYRAAHKIKSSIAIFKLEGLRALILPIEEYSRDLTGLSKIPGLFNKFKKECGSIITELQKELATLKTKQN